MGKTKFELVLSKHVKDDLRRIFTWYEKQQNGLGLRFLQEFELLLDKLVENPFLFQQIENNKRRQVFY